MAHMKRISRMLCLLLAAVAILLTGCQKEEDFSLKKELAFSVPGTVTGKLNPFFASEAGDLAALSMMTDRFLSSDGIAETSESIDADGNLAVTVTIRENIYCWDKSELFSGDFMYAVQFVCDPSYNGPYTALAKSSLVGLSDFRSGKSTTLAGLEKVDAHTCRVLFSDPNEDYHTLLDLPAVRSANYGGYTYGNCAEADVVAKYAKVIGTGAWYVNNLIPSDGKIINFKPSEHYRAGNITAKKATLRCVKEEDVGLKIQLGQLTLGFLYDKELAQAQAEKYGLAVFFLQDGAFLCAKDAPYFSAATEEDTILQALVAISAAC